MASDVAADAAPARPGAPAVAGRPRRRRRRRRPSPAVRPPLPDRPVVRRPDDVGSEPGDADGRAAPPRPRPAGPAHRRRPAQHRRPPGARAAGRPAPAEPPQGRPRAAAAGLRRGRGRARRAEAQERRPLHHPPARRRHRPGRPRHGHHDAGRGAAARHGRGHRRHAGDDHRRVRLGGHPPRRRRHQDRQGQAGRRRPGRDDPQDDRRDGPRPAGAGHQAGRPAAQHAHAALPPAREAGEEGARDAGDPRPAGPPAGYEHDQVGARGPRVRHALPEALRRDRAAGRRAGAVAGHLPRRGHLDGQRAAEDGEDRGRRHRPAQALLLDLPEDDRPRPRLHRHLGPRRHPDPGRLGARLLRGAGHHARALAAGAGPLQGLRGDAEVQHVPVAAHDGDRAAGQAGRAADPHARHAPHRRVRHRRALEVQGEGAGRRQAERRRVRRAQGRLARRHAVAAPAAGLAARGPGARRVPRDAALRPRSAGGLRLHAQGRRDQPARGVHAGRLRLRGAHRGRLPHASAPG